MMKPKMKPNVKESIKSLEVGQSVEFQLDSASENTIRSTVSRVTKEDGRKFSTFRNIAVRTIPSIKVTRIA